MIVLYGRVMINGEVSAKEPQVVLLDRSGDSFKLEASNDISAKWSTCGIRTGS